MPHRLVVLGLGFVIATGGVLHAQWLNYPTPGIPRSAEGKPDLKAPIPKTADGKPDLSGIWMVECGAPEGGCFDRSLFFDLAKGLPPSDVEMTPWAAAIQQQRENRAGVDDPAGYCHAIGYPRMAMVNPFKILQTPHVTVFLHETPVPGPTFRQVLTDGRRLPVDPEPTWMGYSIGAWNGETFVVDTTGFRDKGWLDTRKGRPHSDALHLTERFQRVDFGHLQWEIRIDDPKAFRRPWVQRAVLTLVPDTELLQGFCENHEKTMEHRRIDVAPPEPASPPPERR